VEQLSQQLTAATCSEFDTGWLIEADAVRVCFDGDGVLTLDDLALTTPSCGNGVREGTEACDGSDASLCRDPLSCDSFCDCAGAPAKLSVSGDSISQGFAADCDDGGFFAAIGCLSEGDKPQFNWLDGSSSLVTSVQKRYLPTAVASQRESVTGAEMVGGDDNFVAQAGRIVAQPLPPDHVAVLLGGNDLCSRDCVAETSCSEHLYPVDLDPNAPSEPAWRPAVKAGLDVLVQSLPLGSTVILAGVPRVQSLRDTGVAKPGTNCSFNWSFFGVCEIVTNGGTQSGESQEVREAGVGAAQQAYNETLAEIADEYNTNVAGVNPRGIEVLSDYDGEIADGGSLSIGTTQFEPEDIDAADCFHPSILAGDPMQDIGQNLVAVTYFDFNPDR
jgi:lysophospholipase L1-like esterase